MSTFRSPRGRIDVPAQFIGALLAAFVLSLVLTVAPAFAGSFATVQGQSKGTATWVSGNLSGWQELDLIPMRVLIDPSSADVNNVSTITIEYDHTKTKGGSVYQGLDRPRGFAVAPGDESKIQCLNCAAPVRSEPTGSDTWSVTFQVRPLVAAPSAITFQARLRAGAHYFTGSSLALGGSATPGSGLGLLQVVKPQAKNGSPDLQLTKTGPSVAAPGSTVAYTLNFGNKFTATSPATGIQLTDTLPSGVTYTSGCVAPACSVSADGRTVVWDLGDLDVGTSGSVSFIATVAAGLPYGTVLTNTAEIDSAENDANLADNRASATTEVHFNRAPAATAQSGSTDEDTAKTITLSGSDPDSNSLTYTITSLPANGTLYDGGTPITSVGPSGYVLSGNQVSYLPDANYNGPDSFAFKTSDGSLDSSTATVSLDVTPVDDAPVAHDDHSPSTVENAPPITIDLRPLVSDVETSTAYLAYTIVSGPGHGVLQEISGANGTFSYRSDANYNGSDIFTYKVTDRGDPDNCTGPPTVSCSDQLDSEVKTVPITIKPSPAPQASPTPTVQVVLTRPRIETVPIKKIAKLPRYCASRRHFGIRLRGPHGDPLVKAQVFVNGRQVKVIRGRRLTSQVDLRGLPNGRFTVTIIVTTESGRQLKGSRRYRTCTPRIVRKHKRPPKV